MPEHSPTYSYPWFSYHGKYTRNTPKYYDTKNFEWAKIIEDNYNKIKVEIENFIKLKDKNLDPYFNVDLVKGENKWRIGGFYFWGKKFEDNCKYIPTLEKILTTIPGFVSAGLSILEPNTSIELHNGDTDASIRGHLPFKVPAQLPSCGFEVDGIQKNWNEGELLLFNDAQLHRAWNNTNEKRYLLIFDVIKPEYLNQQDDVCKNAQSLIELQRLEYKYPLVKKLPGTIRGYIRRRIKSKLN